MAARSAGLHTTIWESLTHHVVLPPRLPGRQESRLDSIDQGLNEGLLESARLMRDLMEDLFRDQWDDVRRILLSCKLLHRGGKLTKATLLSAFRGLKGDDALILHIAEQNAGLIIRKLQQFVVARLFDISWLMSHK